MRASSEGVTKMGALREWQQSRSLRLYPEIYLLMSLFRMTKVGPSLHDSHVVSGELIAGALPHSIAHLAHLFDASYVSASIQTALDILKKISVRSRGDDKTIVYVRLPVCKCFQVRLLTTHSPPSEARSKR